MNFEDKDGSGKLLPNSNKLGGRIIPSDEQIQPLKQRLREACLHQQIERLEEENEKLSLQLEGAVIKSISATQGEFFYSLLKEQPDQVLRLSGALSDAEATVKRLDKQVERQNTEIQHLKTLLQKHHYKACQNLPDEANCYFSSDLFSTTYKALEGKQNEL